MRRVGDGLVAVVAVIINMDRDERRLVIGAVVVLTPVVWDVVGTVVGGDNEDEKVAKLDRPAVVERLAVPSVTGQNLSDARSQLRVDGFRAVPVDVHPHYATRNVLRYGNWYVLGQCPGPGGSHDTSEPIMLGVVKVEELTPDVRAAAGAAC